MSAPLRWSSACVTDVGRVRKLNEDACLSLPERGLWVVADGMGGHDAGDLASRWVVETLGALPAPHNLGDQVEAARERLRAVNRRLREEAGRRGKSVIGTTVAALVAFEGHGVYLWAGDSRVYRFRRGRLRRLSRDHSQVEELVAEGLLAPEEAESHPAANVITRAVGGEENLEVDAEIVELAPRDLFLLCSDGLYKELSETDIAGILARTPSPRAARQLVDTALERGARDNVTALVVRVEPAEPGAPPPRQRP
ncbi:MAG: protein phosphatase 2C domain-containing protein [Gammaproteobacteria bacterium]|nr:protein phosphatase 2C domain-containing protein [Gammaproteobacteria bacterium]